MITYFKCRDCKIVNVKPNEYEYAISFQFSMEAQMAREKKHYIYDKLCLADAACAVFTQQMVEFNATTPFVPASLSWCEPDISYPLLPFSLSHVIIVFSFESCLHTNNNKKKETNFNEKKITISSR